MDAKGEDRRCAHTELFQKLLKFCYTNEYPNFTSTEPLEAAKLVNGCTSHVYLYMLGKQYEIEEILPHATKGFAEDMERLRVTDIHKAAFIVELVYKLPHLATHEVLCEEARKQAGLIVEDFPIMISDEVIEKEIRKQIEELMPNAGPSLLDRGVKPKTVDVAKQPDQVMSADALDAAICIRCYSLLDPIEIATTRLCYNCRPVTFVEQRVDAPNKALQGVSMAFWQCSGCDKRWYAEGSRTTALAMEECPSCLPSPDRGRRQKGKALKQDPTPMCWSCSRCHTVWRTGGADKGTKPELKLCLCCVHESD
jgi:hypothetical protein